MLHQMKIPTVVLVISQGRSRSRASLKYARKKVVMTLESKCQMTEENKNTNLFFYFISSLRRKLHNK